MNKKLSFKVIFSVFFCAVFMFTFSFVYLKANIKKMEKVQKEERKIPYRIPPENQSIKINLNEKTYYLTLYFKKSKVIFSKEKPFSSDLYITSDYDFLEGLIDILGGLEIAEDSGMQRYTGIDVVSVLQSENCRYDFKISVLNEIFKRISKNGFSNDDFVYIIENSDTNLNMPVLLSWQEFLKDIFYDYEVIL